MENLAKDFRQDVLSLDTKNIYHKYFCGNNIWYFKEVLKISDYSLIYDNFKSFLAKKFNVSFNNIAIVGSAKTGFSIAPGKELRPFRTNAYSEKPSDIDVAIISSEYFNLFWNEYLTKLYSEYTIHDLNYVRKCLFRKFVVFDGFDISENIDKEYNNWLRKTNYFQKELQEEFNIIHTVNYRIFESWDAAEKYYLNTLDKIKNYIKTS